MNEYPEKVTTISILSFFRVGSIKAMKPIPQMLEFLNNWKDLTASSESHSIFLGFRQVEEDKLKEISRSTYNFYFNES